MPPPPTSLPFLSPGYPPRPQSLPQEGQFTVKQIEDAVQALVVCISCTVSRSSYPTHGTCLFYDGIQAMMSSTLPNPIYVFKMASWQ